MTKKAARSPFYSDIHLSWAIPLTRGVIALVDRDIADALGQFNWHANNVGGIRWYAMRNGNPENWNEKTLMHKVILPVRDGLDVDHCEHYDMADLLIDNRRANLREGSRMQNMQNADIRSDNQSGFKGVTWDAARGKWSSSLMFNYKRISLGRYSDRIEAAKAYDAAAIKLFGEYAKTNEHLGRYKDMAA